MSPVFIAKFTQSTQYKNWVASPRSHTQTIKLIYFLAPYSLVPHRNSEQVIYNNNKQTTNNNNKGALPPKIKRHEQKKLKQSTKGQNKPFKTASPPPMVQVCSQKYRKDFLYM